MKINSISYIPSNFKQDNELKKPLPQLQCDVFQKSNTVSFTGITPISYTTEITLIDICNQMTEGACYNLIKKQAATHKRDPRLFNSIFNDYPEPVRNFFQRNKIIDFAELKSFIDLYKKYSSDIIQIYNSLENKKDINAYPELILYMYNEYINSEESEEDEDFDQKDLNSMVQDIIDTLNSTENFDPNPVLEVLHNTASKDIDDFKSKFYFLSDRFNDFDGNGDVLDALNYLKDTEPRKREMAKAILPEKTFEKDYKAAKDVIDYLYEKNNGESIEPLIDFIDIISKYNKLKNSEIKIISSALCKQIDNISDKISFFEYLHKINMGINDFLKIANKQKSIINDNDINYNIENRDAFVSEISNIKEVSKEEANSIYCNFCDLFGALENNKQYKTLIQTIDKYKLSNSNEMLSLYNKMNGTKINNKEGISKDDFAKYIDLMYYCEFKYSSKSNISTIIPIREVIQNKDAFLKVKDKIEEFLEKDDDDYFAGKSPFEIYSQYKASILSNPDDIINCLQQISQFGIKDSAEYAQKINKINSLKTYIQDSKTLHEFINANDIKFDNSNQDNEHINNCIKIFELVKTSPELTKYYIESDFIAESKSFISEFFEANKDENAQIRMLNLMGQKEVPSLQAFNKLMTDFKDDRGKYNNVITHLESMPEDINFTNYSEYLYNVENALKTRVLPFKIDNSNILTLSPQDLYISEQYNSRENIKYLLNRILGAEDGSNFIQKLPNTYIKKPSYRSAYVIAEEIAQKSDILRDGYPLICEKLGIKEYNTKAITEKIPPEFVDFVNSYKWAIHKDGKIPNISLHAILRIIERYGLTENDGIEHLYKQETIDYLKNIIKAIYETEPVQTTGQLYSNQLGEITSDKKRIVIVSQVNNQYIESIFSDNGKMITTYMKRR